MGKEGWFERAIDQTLNVFFSKDKKYLRLVLILMLVGFVLRLIAALHLDVFADDMIYASQSANIWKAKILSTHSHPPLFSYLTDFAYHLFGYTTFASRLFPLICGTLMIGITFLITKRLMGSKVALASSLFVAFSAFLIRMTFTEHSLVTLFFIFFGVYLSILYLDSKKTYFLITSAVLFGLGTLTKYNAPFFIASFLLFAVYHHKSKAIRVFSRKNIKHFGIFVALIVLISLPFLAFNYFIYQEKGLADFQFTRILKPEKALYLFGGLGGQDKNFIQSLVYWPNYQNYKLLYKADLILLLFAIAGIFLMVKDKKKEALYFFLIFLIVPFILQSAGNALQKHFVFMPVLASLPAGYALVYCLDKLRSPLYKKLLVALLIILMCINMGTVYGTPKSYLSSSPTSELKSYLNSHVGANDLVVFDARIYTAQSYWLATPHHLLNNFQFTKFYEQNQNLSRNMLSQVNVYFVECAKDDCGWGTISSQPDLNASAESFFGSIASQMKVDKIVTEKVTTGNEFLHTGETIDSYKVYHTTTMLNPRFVELTDSINSFYFVPYLYKDMSQYVFNYSQNTFGKQTITSLSYYIIFLSVILALVSFIYALFVLIASNKE